jgi:HD-like signal output (HDOD) protein
VVNSAFYGLPGQIASVDRAIVLLGLSAVKNIAIAASIARMFKAQNMGGGFTARDLWRHSVAVGVAGRLIAKEVRHAGPADEIFLAGLIHDIGIMVAWQANADAIVQVVERCVTGGGSYVELENQVIGADHQAFGLGLTVKWKFPRHLRAIVSLHHQPERLSPELQASANIIRIADVLCCRQKIGFYLTAADTELTDKMFATVNLNPSCLDELVERLHEELGGAEAALSTTD